MQNRQAVIDIGTNSVRLLMCMVNDGNLCSRQKSITVTRIGKDVDKTKRLNPMRMHATTEAIKGYVEQAKNEGITNIYIFATSAVRDAENSDEFLAIVKNETGIDVDIILGNQEASYGFMGVVNGRPTKNQNNIVVIDIGGGSTEIVLGTPQGEILYSHSFNVGAVRMTDRFGIGHNASLATMRPITELVYAMFDEQELASKLIRPFDIIGIGGTATTAAAIDLKMTDYDGALIHRHIMNAHALYQIAENLVTTSYEDKLNIRGLHPKRVNIIASGIWILKAIMDYIGGQTLYFSDYDNLEGALYAQNSN